MPETATYKACRWSTWAEAKGTSHYGGHSVQQKLNLQQCGHFPSAQVTIWE